MRLRLPALATAVLCATAPTINAQTLEVVMTQSDMAAIGAPIVSGDPESITVNPLNGNLVVTNGGDTSDSDGDAIAEYVGGGPGSHVKTYCSGNNLEDAALAFTGVAFTNNDFLGIGVNSNGAIIVPIDNQNSLPGDAWMFRVNPGSTPSAPSIDILAGSPLGDGPIDGTIHIAMDGNIAYLLQLRTLGIAETRVVTFDTTAAPQADPNVPVAPTVFLSQADLLEVMTEAQMDSLNAIAIGPGNGDSGRVLILSCGQPDLINVVPAPKDLFAIPVSKATPLALLKSGAAIDAELAADTPGYPGAFGFAVGGITVNQNNGDIYLGSFDTETPGFFEEYDLYRLAGPGLSAEVFKPEVAIEADPAYINEGGPGEVEAQDYGFVISGGHLYITLETATSNTDYFGRLSLPGATPLLGDVNLDTFVDVRDVTALGNAIALIEPLPPGANGDINGDTFVNSADVTALVAIIVP